MPTNCAGITRRDCLQIGLGGLLGGGFVTALRAAASASPAKAKSCILIWMDGGPTHFETFDPKPDAPAEYRGEFKAIPTAVPGVRFSEHMPQLAKHLDKYAIIRSIRHEQGNHGAGNHYMMTGAPPRIPVGCGAFVSFHPSMGSVVAYEKPAPVGLPSYFSMPSMSRSGGPNFLGAKYAPFVADGDPNSPSFRIRDVALPTGLTEGRFADRGSLRSEVDQFQRILDKSAGDPAVALDEHYLQANQLMQSKEAQAAFRIQDEPTKVRDKYGRNSFGQRCLLARRLVDAGVPFVTVYDGGWDHHSDIFGALKKRLPSWDNSVAALINDLHERGTLDSTMVIALGEFGRTPKLSTLPGSNTAGRDHWANAMSVLFAGGGTPGGQVIGATDRNGFAAMERVLAPENFVSTVYAKLGIDPSKILFNSQGRPNQLVSEPHPIKELMG
jgi:uncharacterized protein (DUF1501 family)